MRAVLPAGADPVSSYRWQEGSSGKWTDMSSTKAHQSATSTRSGARVFRVVASYGSLGSASSLPVMVVWRPLGVVVSSSPAYPESGDAAKRTVTLTASSTAPTGATYQWQQWSNGGWTNLGTVSTSTVKSVSYGSRGTRKFRAMVSYGTLSPATSPPVYVTWDEAKIFVDLITELASTVTTTAAYKNAEKQFLQCVNVGRSGDKRYASFEDVLGDYAGAVKSAVDDCEGRSSSSTRMFVTVQGETKTALASLKSKSEYAGLLSTERGREFESRVGNASVLKLAAHHLAYEPPQPTGSTTASVIAPKPPQLPSGFGCLTEAGSNPSLKAKLRALNCLVFTTAHAFWVKNKAKLRVSLTSSVLLDGGLSAGPFPWLSLGGDDRCSVVPDGPRTACFKHDFIYGSLSKFVGTGSYDEIDTVWNPRNRAATDAKFQTDIARYGCEAIHGGWDPGDIGIEITCAFSSENLAWGMAWGVRNLPSWAYPAFPSFEWGDWPTLQEDLDSIQRSIFFIECKGDPRVEIDFKVIRENQTVTIGWSNWTLPKTCSGVVINKVELCWSIRYETRYLMVDIPGEILRGCIPLSSASSVNLLGYKAHSITLQIRSYPDPMANPYTQTVYRWNKK